MVTLLRKICRCTRHFHQFAEDIDKTEASLICECAVKRPFVFEWECGVPNKFSLKKKNQNQTTTGALDKIRTGMMSKGIDCVEAAGQCRMLSLFTDPRLRSYIDTPCDIRLVG